MEDLQKDIPLTRDRFGCSLTKLQGSETLTGGNILFHRKSSDSTDLSQVIAPASNDGFLIGISMVDGHRRRIFQEHHAQSYDFERNSLYIRDSADYYRADLMGNFDFVLMEISDPALEQIAEGADFRRSELTRIVGHSDPALGGLVTALFSSVSETQEKSFLFVDQLAAAIGTYILHTYGNGTEMPANRRHGLTRRDENLVKQLLVSRLNGDISVAELAAECGMSRTSFLRAFRDTTRLTPNQWLMQHRIEIARKLLRNSDRSLGEISKLCGFSGASHFSRAFLSATGMTPSLWRRG